MGRKEEVFEPALQNKKVPVLTLDNKWHRLFDKTDKTEVLVMLEERLNDLLKRQGKLNTESKDIRRIKKKLMDEIVPFVDELAASPSAALEKKIDDNKRLIADCNQKLEEYRDELMDLPREIDKANYDLMLATMDACYDTLQENTVEIEETAKWIAEMRVELKKRLVRKQEKEQANHELYSYMHAIFGPEVIDIFDLKYNPEEHRPKPAQKSGKKPKNEEPKVPEQA